MDKEDLFIQFFEKCPSSQEDEAAKAFREQRAPNEDVQKNKLCMARIWSVCQLEHGEGKCSSIIQEVKELRKLIMAIVTSALADDPEYMKQPEPGIILKPNT